MSLQFAETTITIKVADGEQAVDRQVTAMVAEGAGLAYLVHQGGEGEEPAISLTHIASQTRVGGDWQVSTEREARAWIEALNDLMDWTGRLPTIRQNRLGRVMHLACIGALHELEEEAEL